MLPEDQRRLDRELSIYKATRGYDYTRRDQDIARVKAHAGTLAAISDDTHARESAGYQAKAASGEIQLIDGRVPPFRKNPTNRQR